MEPDSDHWIVKLLDGTVVILRVTQPINSTGPIRLVLG
jgi:hypothetical protein